MAIPSCEVSCGVSVIASLVVTALCYRASTAYSGVLTNRACEYRKTKKGGGLRERHDYARKKVVLLQVTSSGLKLGTSCLTTPRAKFVQCVALAGWREGEGDSEFVSFFFPPLMCPYLSPLRPLDSLFLSLSFIFYLLSFLKLLFAPSQKKLSPFLYLVLFLSLSFQPF